MPLHSLIVIYLKRNIMMSFPFYRSSLIGFILLGLSSFGFGQTPITIPDGNFSTAGGPNTLTSVLFPGDQVAQLGTTPWYSQLQTPIGLGLLTSANITGGGVVLSTPLSLGVGTTAAFVYQNLANPFQLGTYTLTTTFSASSPLSLSLLTSSGIGLGFLNNATTTNRGTEVSSSASTPSLLSLNILSGNSGTLSYTFNNTSITGGNLGIELFSGNGSLLSAGLLGGGTMGPVSLTFSPAAVPEPSALALMGVGFIALIGLRTIKRRATHLMS
jgi:hypothetical protein